MKLLDKLFNRNKKVIGKRAYYSTVDKDYLKVVDYSTLEEVRGVVSENGQIYFLVEIHDILEKE